MQSSRLTYGYRVTYKEVVRMIVILSYKWIQSLRIKRRGQDDEVSHGVLRVGRESRI